ncbi:MAG: N-acetyl-gamma-glutamyl-phosphate reductase, partial [Candidatus Omnitrophica bacterium]|nr:N-acetyl-gamma-glutamyl-phosphate reductase [Candidatus Omnitrophota bacterium]
PHTVSMEFVPQLLVQDKYIIDLSADYRLKDPRIYKEFYKIQHKDEENLKKAVYGLPEFYRYKIKNKKLIANPGCYPTVSILAVAPLLALEIVEPQNIIIDAKSGVSGAGKKLVEELLFCEVDEDFRAYKPNLHQHIPEIKQELNRLSGQKINLTFVPHILPLKRGIFITVYANKKEKKKKDLLNLYKRFYKKEPFIRIRDDLPSLKDVVGTNYCDITLIEEREKIILIAVIDNLLKGAAGQAVQNMNIIFGYQETLGLL